MKRSLSIICVFFIVFLLSGCGKSSFDGSRTGNDSQFVMKYKIFNTTDEQSLFLESGNTIRTEVIVDSGKLSIKIQKDSDTPIYERDDIRQYKRNIHFLMKICVGKKYRPILLLRLFQLY